GASILNTDLGEPCRDSQLTTYGNTPSLARRLADKLGGHYAYLHDKACRVVVPLNESQESGQADKEVIFDIAPLKGGSIENDLRQRDFTINALAVPLDDVVDTCPPDRVPLAGTLSGGQVSRVYNRL